MTLRVSSYKEEGWNLSLTICVEFNIIAVGGERAYVEEKKTMCERCVLVQEERRSIKGNCTRLFFILRNAIENLPYLCLMKDNVNWLK